MIEESISRSTEDRFLQLRTTIADVLDVDEQLIGEETHFVNELGVDSLMALEIMVTLERSFGLKLSEADLKHMSCLRDVRSLLQERLQSPTSSNAAINSHEPR